MIFFNCQVTTNTVCFKNLFFSKIRFCCRSDRPLSTVVPLELRYFSRIGNFRSEIFGIPLALAQICHNGTIYRVEHLKGSILLVPLKRVSFYVTPQYEVTFKKNLQRIRIENNNFYTKPSMISTNRNDFLGI